MKTKTKDKIIDAISAICLGIMFVFGHGCELWCIAIAMVFGILVLILQNCVRTREEEGAEYDF